MGILTHRDGANTPVLSLGARLVHWKEAGIHRVTTRTPFDYLAVKILGFRPFTEIRGAPGY